MFTSSYNGMVLHIMTWHGMAWLGIVLQEWAWCDITMQMGNGMGMVWMGMAGYGIEWYGMVWYDIGWLWYGWVWHWMVMSCHVMV